MNNLHESRRKKILLGKASQKVNRILTKIYEIKDDELQDEVFNLLKKNLGVASTPVEYKRSTVHVNAFRTFKEE